MRIERLLELGLLERTPNGQEKRGARGTPFTAQDKPFTVNGAGIRTGIPIPLAKGDWSGPFEGIWDFLSRVDFNFGVRMFYPSAGISDRIGHPVGCAVV